VSDRAPGERSSAPFDVVFCDTCIGGSTVLSSLARTRSGLRAFFLADYAVNPLGVKDQPGVKEALDQWLDRTVGRADTLVVACNTASVRLQDSPEVKERARSLGIRLLSMVDFLDQLIRKESERLLDKRVCLMGTEFTVGRPLYRERLERAGVREVVLLPATRTERLVARLEYTSPRARDEIREEIQASLAGVDAVVLACTCFPLVGDILRELSPGIELLDPAAGVENLPGLESREGPNRLTLALSGEVLTPEELTAQAPELFPGWELEEVENIERLDEGATRAYCSYRSLAPKVC